jgi:peptidase M15-like protein
MVDLSKRLSLHFRLGELLRSETAERNSDWIEEQYSPSEEVIGNLSYLVSTALEPIRATFGYPIRITSGYRCAAVNKAVGSKPSSQHLKGQAADCQVDPAFLTDPAVEPLRTRIRQRILERTGQEVRDDLNANFYLFAYVSLRMQHFDIDQLIHEYGAGPGRPAWVHIAASPGPEAKSQILALGTSVPKNGAISLEEALGMAV